MKRLHLFPAGMFALITVGVLTIVNHVSMSSVTFAVLYPGLALSLLITGGHGGTTLEEHLALLAGFITNVMVYFFAALMVERAFQSLTYRS